ncbi:hypothetical protein PAHAL_3G161700 [Panicum hallii]|uniref:Uncharacterized protein n=1 Tax=Panicum hallii TaxID=206008 RepID=A0A2S3H974_9POAL|nr:hypothetical protein PAHAL_3G161700 [Panicum hallii]
MPCQCMPSVGQVLPTRTAPRPLNGRARLNCSTGRWPLRPREPGDFTGDDWIAHPSKAPVCNSTGRARGSRTFAVSKPHAPRFSTHCLVAAAVQVPRRPRAHSSRLGEPRQAAAASLPQPGHFQELGKKMARRAGGGAVAACHDRWAHGLLDCVLASAPRPIGLPGSRRWSRGCSQGRPTERA